MRNNSRYIIISEGARYVWNGDAWRKYDPYLATTFTVKRDALKEISRIKKLKISDSIIPVLSFYHY